MRERGGRLPVMRGQTLIEVIIGRGGKLSVIEGEDYH